MPRWGSVPIDVPDATGGMNSRRHVLSAALLASSMPAASASADASWNANVPPGQSTPLHVRMEIDAPIVGTDSDQATGPSVFAGGSAARLIPSQPPFTMLRFVDFDLDFSDVSLQFQMYCSSVLGCQDYAVTVVESHLSLPETTAVALDPATGAFSLAAQFQASFVAHLSTQGGEFDFDVGGLVSATLTGRVEVEGAVARLRDLSMTEFLFPVPPDALPLGVTGTVFVRPLFTPANMMVGPWSPVVAGDIDGDGLVDGEDLGLLLGAWGLADAAADLDGSGLVDGPDLAILLGGWGS